MKKIIAIVAALCFSAAAFAGPEPTEAAVKAFKAAFPAAENAQWFDSGNGKYMVNFTQSGINTKVTYDKDGVFVSSIRYYEEKNLPVNVLYAVKKKHADKKISGITELSSDQELSYYIKMEDDKFWYTIKSTSDGSLETVEKFKKG